MELFMSSAHTAYRLIESQQSPLESVTFDCQLLGNRVFVFVFVLLGALHRDAMNKWVFGSVNDSYSEQRHWINNKSWVSGRHWFFSIPTCYPLRTPGIYQDTCDKKDKLVFWKLSPSILLWQSVCSMVLFSEVHGELEGFSLKTKCWHSF